MSMARAYPIRAPRRNAPASPRPKQRTIAEAAAPVPQGPTLRIRAEKASRSPRRTRPRRHPDLIIAECEAAFWNRPAETIGTLPPLHGIMNLSDLDPPNSRGTAPARRTLPDRMVADHIRALGPCAFADPAIQDHFDALWTTMVRGPRAEKRLARARWSRIMSRTLPDFRRDRGPTIAPSPVEVADAVTQAEQAIADAKKKKRRQPAALKAELRAQLPKWPARRIDDLADAIRERGRRHSIRRIIHAQVAASLDLKGHSLAGLVALGRRIGKLREATRAGQQRHAKWCQGSLRPPSPDLTAHPIG
jgi:hypothetical protein